MSFNLDSMLISGKEVLPLIEGGKGVGVSTGLTSGEWAKAGGIGTVSAVNASSLDENGKIIPVDLHLLGGSIIVQKDGFLCAAKGTKISITLNRRIGSGLVGGEGFILQKLQGDGKADDASLINDWIFEGMAGNGLTLDCTP